jgi:uncharacterized membrane protein
MFEGAALPWKIWRLERARKRVAAKYDLLVPKSLSQADEGAFVFEGQMKIAELDDAVQQLQSNHLIRLAHRYVLVVPPLNQKHESWKESEFTDEWQLTPKAFIELRNAVRTERKARREAWQSHIVGISAATGLIGGLTGLISVIFFHASK